MLLELTLPHQPAWQPMSTPSYIRRRTKHTKWCLDYIGGYRLRLNSEEWTMTAAAATMRFHIWI